MLTKSGFLFAVMIYFVALLWNVNANLPSLSSNFLLYAPTIQLQNATQQIESCDSQILTLQRGVTSLAPEDNSWVFQLYTNEQNTTTTDTSNIIQSALWRLENLFIDTPFVFNESTHCITFFSKQDPSLVTDSIFFEPLSSNNSYAYAVGFIFNISSQTFTSECTALNQSELQCIDSSSVRMVILIEATDNFIMDLCMWLTDGFAILFFICWIILFVIILVFHCCKLYPIRTRKARPFIGLFSILFLIISRVISVHLPSLWMTILLVCGSIILNFEYTVLSLATLIRLLITRRKEKTKEKTEEVRKIIYESVGQQAHPSDPHHYLDESEEEWADSEEEEIIGIYEDDTMLQKKKQLSLSYRVQHCCHKIGQNLVWFEFSFVFAYFFLFAIGFGISLLVFWWEPRARITLVTFGVVIALSLLCVFLLLYFVQVIGFAQLLFYDRKYLLRCHLRRVFLWRDPKLYKLEIAFKLLLMFIMAVLVLALAISCLIAAALEKTLVAKEWFAIFSLGSFLITVPLQCLYHEGIIIIMTTLFSLWNCRIQLPFKKQRGYV